MIIRVIYIVTINLNNAVLFLMFYPHGAVVFAGKPTRRSIEPGSIPSMHIFIHHSSAASMLKSLRSAHWQLLMQFVACSIVNSASYPREKATEELQTSGSAAGLNQQSSTALSIVQYSSPPMCYIKFEK